MKKTIITHCVLGTLLTLTLALVGCQSQTAENMADRLAGLEAEVHALQVQSSARDAAVKEELATIRKNLEGIRSLIEVEKSRAKALDTPKAQSKSERERDKLDEELDIKAKNFVSENLDRLLDLTSKLLDKMEKEIDEQMKKETPAPDGDQI